MFNCIWSDLLLKEKSNSQSVVAATFKGFISEEKRNIPKIQNTTLKETTEYDTINQKRLKYSHVCWIAQMWNLCLNQIKAVFSCRVLVPVPVLFGAAVAACPDRQKLALWLFLFVYWVICDTFSQTPPNDYSGMFPDLLCREREVPVPLSILDF